MIYKILFNIVGFGMMILAGYFSLKLMLIAASLRNRYGKLVGKEWNGRMTRKQLRKLKEYVDEKDKKDIDYALSYWFMPWKIVVAGIFLLIVTAYFNKSLNG